MSARPVVISLTFDAGTIFCRWLEHARVSPFILTASTPHTPERRGSLRDKVEMSFCAPVSGVAAPKPDDMRSASAVMNVLRLNLGVCSLYCFAELLVQIVGLDEDLLAESSEMSLL